MIQDRLKSLYFQVRALNALTPNSREYRKAFVKLRRSTRFSMMNDFEMAQPEDDAYPFKIRKRRALIVAVILICLSVVMFVLTLIFASDSEIYQFTPEETRAFLLWMIGIFAPLAFALSMAHVIGKIYDAYLAYAIDSLQIDDHDISDAELMQIFDYSDHNIGFLYDEDIQANRCGCYSCMAQFDADELRYDRGSAVCPVCRKDTILFETHDMTVNEDILKKAKRFWG